MNKEKLIEFEDWTVEQFNEGKLKSPVHLSGGNEDECIELFKKIKQTDWVFSTYRSHYHALLKGVPEQRLKDWILDNKSIHFMDKEYKIFTSAIVGGTLSIALGTALALKIQSQRKKNQNEAQDVSGLETRSRPVGEIDNTELMTGDADNHADTHVWCIVGDMTGHTGIFWETIKYAHFHELPITFVIEDNGLSTDTPTEEVWKIDNGSYFQWMANQFPGSLMYYNYVRTWPHYGTGKFISKIWEDIEIDETKDKGF